jgi:hypothetical protein
MSTATNVGPPLGQEIGESVLGLGLLATYLVIFTVGSQIPGPTLRAPESFSDAIFIVLTYRETSVCLLAIVAACLGTWRRINQAHEGMIVRLGEPWFLAYTSACIGGLITTAVVVGLPSLLDQFSDQFTISRDPKDGAGPRNYVSMAMLASAVAFFSGYDKTFLDRLLGLFLRRIGLATTSPPAPTSAPCPPASAVAPPPRPSRVRVVRASRSGQGREGSHSP